MTKDKLMILAIFCISLASCGNGKSNNIKNNIQVLDKDTIINIPIGRDTVLIFDYDTNFKVETSIFYPQPETKPIGIILMLHGWNLPADEWCEKTSFCEKALKQGYVLIVPDYNKSNYSLAVYPETREEYRKYPTLTWMIDTQIPAIQKMTGLLKPGQNNLVAGISTGARGATLLAYYKPDLFKAAASLSGDFDITKMQTEFLYKAFFGNYENFAERWKKECFAFECKNYSVPTYIGHGESDNVSPVEQSKMMYDSIQLNNPELKITGNFPAGKGHNYDYWESETDNILDFFGNIEK
jgi:putative tributyrin esterase